MQTVVSTSLCLKLPNDVARMVESYLCVDIVAVRRLRAESLEELICTENGRLFKLKFHFGENADRLELGTNLLYLSSYISITISLPTGGCVQFFDDENALFDLLHDAWLVKNLDRYHNVQVFDSETKVQISNVSCEKKSVMALYSQTVYIICKRLVAKVIAACPYHPIK